MQFVDREVSEKYQKWLDAFSGENTLSNDCLIGIADILNIHFSMLDFYLDQAEREKPAGKFGLIDKDSLSSALARQIGGYAGYPKWETDYEKCATLFYGLIKNQPFDAE
jgi:death-on-curing protein